MDKKIDCETAIARIKIFMNRYYMDVGREMFKSTDDLKNNLIEDIDEVLINVDIDRKRVVLESLELDKMENKNE